MKLRNQAPGYHLLLVFVSEIKLLYHTWFRTGSAYTANGIVDFLKEMKACRQAGRLATITCPPFGGNSFCLIAGINPGSKNSIWNFKL